MLEQRGANGTYFVTAAWLDDGSGVHSHMLGPSDLAELVQRGHELGCHTYSHKSLLGRSIPSLNDDLDHNRDVLLRESGAESLVSFSYPYGEASWGVKKQIGARFAAARGVRPGINGRIVDLAQLLAVRLCIEDFSKERIHALIQRAKRSRGWLIFYTHGVKSDATRGSCTEEQFAETLDMVVESDIEILPIRNAIGRIMHRAC